MRFATPNAQRSTLNIQLESGGFPTRQGFEKLSLTTPLQDPLSPAENV
jgi:hypothetical protein